MRRLTILIITLALLYSGYWFVGANRVGAGFRNGFANAAIEGWQITYSDLRTVGFPSRFDTTLSDLSVTSPDQQLKYAIPFVQILALSYLPNRAIIAFPETQSLTLGATDWQINAAHLRSSVTIRPSLSLDLDHITAESGPATISAVGGPRIDIQKALLAIRAKDPVALTYDVYAEATDVGLPGAFLTTIDPRGRLPTHVARLSVDSTVTTDRTIDAAAFADPADHLQATSYTLNNLSVDWGDMTIRGDGSFTIDAAGTPDGKVTFRIGSWQEIIPLLVNSGVVAPRVGTTLNFVAASLAKGNDTLDLPLIFRNGEMMLGPVPLGPAPVLR